PSRMGLPSPNPSPPLSGCVTHTVVGSYPTPPLMGLPSPNPSPLYEALPYPSPHGPSTPNPSPLYEAVLHIQ
ncbi:predicted protein, partial [Nematostella vectensis]